MDEDLHIFGEVSVSLSLRSDQDTAQLCCSLCHVFPDGASRLLTYGLLNLICLESSEKLVPGKSYTIKLNLDPIGYSVPSNHRLQLMVCPGSWPTSWPSPLPVTLTLDRGSLTIPILDTLEPQPPSSMFQQSQPRLGPVKNILTLREGSFKRCVDYGMSDLTKKVKVVTDDGRVYYPDMDTEYEEVATDKYYIQGDHPLSARVVCTRTCNITYAARSNHPINTQTQTTSHMSSDKDSFFLTNTLVTRLGGKEFFTKTWEEKIARNGV